MVQTAVQKFGASEKAAELLYELGNALYQRGSVDECLAVLEVVVSADDRPGEQRTEDEARAKHQNKVSATGLQERG